MGSCHRDAANQTCREVCCNFEIPSLLASILMPRPSCSEFYLAVLSSASKVCCNYVSSVFWQRKSSNMKHSLIQVRLKIFLKHWRTKKTRGEKSKTQESKSCIFFVQGQVFITHMHGGENLAPFLFNYCGPHATGGGVPGLGKMCTGGVQLHSTVCRRRGKIILS